MIDDWIEETNQPYETLWSEKNNGIYIVDKDWKTKSYESKTIEKEIGTLSNPSKMPAFAWGIPIEKCNTGSKLAKVKGTICNKCYALKGHYVFKNVKAHEIRRKAIERMSG